MKILLIPLAVACLVSPAVAQWDPPLMIEKHACYWCNATVSDPIEGYYGNYVFDLTFSRPVTSIGPNVGRLCDRGAGTYWDELNILMWGSEDFDFYSHADILTNCDGIYGIKYFSFVQDGQTYYRGTGRGAFHSIEFADGGRRVLITVPSFMLCGSEMDATSEDFFDGEIVYEIATWYARSHSDYYTISDRVVGFSALNPRCGGGPTLPVESATWGKIKNMYGGR